MTWLTRIIDNLSSNAAPEANRRNINNPQIPLSQLHEVWGDESITAAGVRVNETTALNISTVYRCVNVIGLTLASLPFQVFERNGDNKRPAPDHSVYRLIHSEPNQFMTAFNFRLTLIANTLLWGNGYALIIRNNFSEPVAFKLFQSRHVTVRFTAGEIWYDAYDDDTGQYFNNINYRDMIHITALGNNGIMGKSVIGLARESMGLTVSSERAAANTFGDGFKFSGIFEADGEVKNADRLHSSLDKYKGAKGRGKIPVIPPGLKFKQISMPPEDAELLSTRKFQVPEVCRWFGVQPHKAFDLERATFSNIEHQNIDFATDTILPWAERIEQEFDRKCFSEADKRAGRYFTEHNMNGILRADVAARGDYYQKMLDRGVFTINTVLRLENMNTVEDGDRRFIPLNMQPLDKVDENQEANRAILIDHLKDYLKQNEQ